MLPKKQKLTVPGPCSDPATLTLLNGTPVTTACGQQPSKSKINHNSTSKQHKETQLQLKLKDAHTGAVMDIFLHSSVSNSSGLPGCGPSFELDQMV